MDHFPVFKALRGADPEKNVSIIQSNPIRNSSLLLRLHAGKMHESNPEHQLVFKSSRMSLIRKTSLFLRLHAGTIHESKPEHLFVLKAPCLDDPCVQSGTTPCF